MTIINVPRPAGNSEEISNAEKIIGESRAEFNLILFDIINNRNREAHEAECMIFKRLLQIGLLLMKLFFESRGGGDFGEEIETAEGTARRGKTGEKTYFSIFGKLKISRFLYHTAKKSFAPSDIFLNLPKRCYSYYLSEMLNHLNIKGAYSEGAVFIEKFFGMRISVSASETVSNESSVFYEDFYKSDDIPEKHSGKKEFTAVSFDGKGVPMIK